MIKHNLLSKDPAEIRQMWYIPPKPQYNVSWILYTKEFVLESIQKCYGHPEKVKRNFAWYFVSRCLWAGMVLTQLVITPFCYIPVINWGIYMLIRAYPRNAVGFFLRGCYWKTKLKHLGVDTLLDQGVEINGPEFVEIGNHCHIDRNVLLSVGSEKGSIIIGDHVFIGPHCHIAGRGGVEIRSFAALAARVHIYSVTNLPYHPERMGELISMSHAIPASKQSTIENQVIIGEYAVIGFSSLVLPGVSLGTGAIAHAFAEVVTSFPDFSIVRGCGRAKQQGWRRPGKFNHRLKDEG